MARSKDTATRSPAWCLRLIFRVPVGQIPWLNQFDDVIFRHGISLLQWRSGGSNTPLICRFPRFTLSPTFDHSFSWPRAAASVRPKRSKAIVEIDICKER
jgi:hypothetical protein